MKGETKAAASFFETAASGGSLRAWLALGILALSKSAAGEARNHFLKAAKSAQGSGADSLEVLRRTPISGELSADQYYALGLLLEKDGHDITPGFSRARLDMSLWCAFEYFKQALAVNPCHCEALVALGDLLVRQHAYTEAYPFLARASALDAGSAELAEKAALAARHGYIKAAPLKKVA